VQNKKILFLSYNGLTTNLGRSQILPYLQKLSGRGYWFFVVSLEEQRNETRPNETLVFNWHPLYRAKKSRLVSLLKFLMGGIAVSGYLIFRYKINIIHVRSYIPGVIAVLLKYLTPGIKIIFDIRGFMVDEYLEAGLIRPKGFWSRVGRFFERRLFQNSDTVVTLTYKSLEALKHPNRSGKKEIPIDVIPCCVPLDEEAVIGNGRPSLCLGEKEIKLIYTGSLGTWYDFHGMLSFFEMFQKRYSSSTLEIFSPQAEEIRESVQKNRLQKKIRLAEIPFSMVRRHLAGADIGLLFYRRTFSRIGTSPIKFPEYLWAGLPVVATPGVGDLDELIEKYRIGVIIHTDRNEAIDHIAELLKDPELKERCQWVAKKFYDLQLGVGRYEAIYERLAKAPC